MVNGEMSPITSHNSPFTMKLLTHLPSWLRNKYFLSAAGFVVWMLFFDPRDLYSQLERGKELRNLQASKKHYQEQIAMESAELQQLKTNPSTLEKYAREKYLMKKENEELFIVSEKPEMGKK